jgi:hypothetical protein
MTRQTQWIVYVVIAAALVFSFYKLVNVATSVSYPYGEEYRIDAGERQLVNAVNAFKKQHPEYCVPVTLTMPGGKEGQLLDGPRGKNDYWYHAYFYYPKENQVIKTWMKPIDSSHTTFAFDAVNNGLKIGNWRGVNKDYNEADRETIKQAFEQRILKEIKGLAEQHS